MGRRDLPDHRYWERVGGHVESADRKNHTLSTKNSLSLENIFPWIQNESEVKALSENERWENLLPADPKYKKYSEAPQAEGKDIGHEFRDTEMKEEHWIL